MGHSRSGVHNREHLLPLQVSKEPAGPTIHIAIPPPNPAG